MSDTTTGASVQPAQPVKPETPYVNRGPAILSAPGRTPYATPYGAQNGQVTSSSYNFLAHGLQGLALHDGMYNVGSRSNNVSTTGGPLAAFGVHNGIPGSYWTNSMLQGHQYSHVNGHPPSAMFSPATAQYMTHGYSEHSPMSSAWTPNNGNGELPTLITPRRESISSLENDTPSTPMYPGYSTIPQGGITILNRSPSGAFTTSTPSPLQVMTHYGVQMNKAPELEAISPRLKMIITKEPSIPPAIPAPSSPLKPLDRALENVRGETNVYIRGLMPDTSDSMLEDWGRRFGDIKSSKSIIDHTTGLCKGFGFVRFHNFKDAEDCIRGFHHLGYEVSFARESFYSKLKAVADDGNTNLYVSNLPKSMNEHELATIFTPRKVCSARILRNSNGTGRGVGFARFESRVDCEEVIKAFNNKTIMDNGEEHTIQIRYADTQEQKHLKQTTAAARQFRSAEYEYATNAHRNGWFVNDRVSLSGHSSGSPSVNEFEAYLGQSAVVRGPTLSDPGFRGAFRPPLAILSPNMQGARYGSMTAAATPTAKAVSQDNHENSVNMQRADKENPTKDGEVSPSRGKDASKK